MNDLYVKRKVLLNIVSKVEELKMQSQILNGNSATYLSVREQSDVLQVQELFQLVLCHQDQSGSLFGCMLAAGTTVSSLH